MTTTRIFSILLLLVAVAMGWYLVHSIKSTVDQKEKIKAVEAKVIERLEMIKKAELAYLAVNGKYTSDWGKLASFVENGTFYITQKSEEVITLDYGADSVVVDIDTLGTRPVLDSLFGSTPYKDMDFSQLKYIPGSEDKTFDIYADEIENRGILIDVIEVKDTAPINPIRKESNNAVNKKPLRFGSRTDVKTSGNWE